MKEEVTSRSYALVKHLSKFASKLGVVTNLR